MSRSEWVNSASAKINDKFISIQSYSGYSLALIDPTVPEFLLKPDVTDEVLGLAILNALKQSRCLSIEEARVLRLNVESNYSDWVGNKMILYSYKTKRALFKNMKSCEIELQKETITIHPTHHEKLQAWDGRGFTEKDYVKIRADNSPAEIAAALRLGFSRCTG